MERTNTYAVVKELILKGFSNTGENTLLKSGRREGDSDFRNF
jgi:hypothetical protein